MSAVGGDAGRLRGRSALVTGGTRGIGAAVVRLFAAEGAGVVFAGGLSGAKARIRLMCALGATR